MSTAIKVENLSKIYRLGEIGTGTITKDIDRWFKTKVLGKEDPFLKIGESNDRAKKGNGDIVYSLQDINFEINQGDAVGIIGRNGAGKSTLLKILSRVTTPTKGKINIKGRVASLLEVGTGFHPELTGRENIYLNGAILGMRKREIDRKLDEIIDFSGVERYIDTPVKRYSSGMYVRLAFAVAAHLESEILIVDEVLAVGDAEFQKKCLGKMGEVSRGEGRTVLFVSHSMASVSSLCERVILMSNGTIEYNDITSKTISYYLNGSKLKQRKYNNLKYENFNIISEVKLLSHMKAEKYIFSFEEVVIVQLLIKITSIVNGTFVGFTICNEYNQKVFSDVFKIPEIYLKGDQIIMEVVIPSRFLLAGNYSLDAALFASNIGNYDYVQEACTFEILDFESKFSIFNDLNVGNVMVDCNWNIIES
jgi:lipopolysaccharide transport system ATP-binding protein